MTQGEARAMLGAHLIGTHELIGAYVEVLTRAVERQAMTVEEAESHYERVVHFRRDLEAKQLWLERQTVS